MVRHDDLSLFDEFALSVTKQTESNFFTARQLLLRFVVLHGLHLGDQRGQLFVPFS